MPHAIQIRQTGGPEVLNWTPIKVGEPGSGQVRLRQAAAGLNYIDVYHRTGYYSQPLPFIPGLEGAGIVEAIGQAVRGLKVGDRVALPVPPVAIPRCGSSRPIDWCACPMRSPSIKQPR
jgi:NADPH:quinone reductase